MAQNLGRHRVQITAELGNDLVTTLPLLPLALLPMHGKVLRPLIACSHVDTDIATYALLYPLPHIGLYGLDIDLRELNALLAAEQRQQD
jgi:hypothetical protein